MRDQRLADHAHHESRGGDQSIDQAGGGLPPSAVSVDGTSSCGTFARAGAAGVHPLAAIAHTTGEHATHGLVPGQRQVTQKTSEIAWFAPELDRLELTAEP